MTATSPHIVVVEDDVEIGSMVSKYLDSNDFCVTVASNARELDRTLAESRVDLVLLDINLPGEDGLSICRRLRAGNPSLPIIMLTARSEEIDRVIGLEMGADDYVPKPFSLRELLARTRAVLRRRTLDVAPSGGTNSFTFSGWQLSVRRRELLSPEGGRVSIPAAEFDLLHAFCERPGRVLSRDQLLDLTQGRVAGPLPEIDRRAGEPVAPENRVRSEATRDDQDDSLRRVSLYAGRGAQLMSVVRASRGPRSIAGQMVMLVVLVVLLFQLVTAVLFTLVSDGRTPSEPNDIAGPGRFADFVRVLDRLPVAARADALGAMQAASPGLELRLLSPTDDCAIQLDTGGLAPDATKQRNRAIEHVARLLRPDLALLALTCRGVEPGPRRPGSPRGGRRTSSRRRRRRWHDSRRRPSSARAHGAGAVPPDAGDDRDDLGRIPLVGGTQPDGTSHPICTGGRDLLRQSRSGAAVREPRSG